MNTLLITGASTGFGRNAALAMAGRGWRVFASMRDITKGESLLSDLEAAKAAGTIELIELDVTVPESITSGVAQVLQATDGSIDALLNNAGYSLLGPFEEMTETQCRQQMETNFFGTLAVTKAVLPTMRAARAGRIVTVSSNAVNSPHPMLTLYAASKWALEGWAEGLAMEMAPFGVHVSVLQPGAHRTPFATNVVPTIPENSAYGDWLATAMPGIGNLDQWGRPAELATAPIVAALTGEDDSFRIAVGGDTEIFAALKGAFPFELRAAILRAIVGLPAPGAYTDRDEPVPSLPPATLAMLAMLAQSDELRRTVAAIVSASLPKPH